MINLTTTPQQIFEIIATHLLEQMERANDKRSTCVYLTEHRLKCAAGILIPDGHPAQLYDGLFKLVLRRFSDLHALYNEHLQLIQELQNIHDCYRVSSWRIELEQVARDRQLSTDFLTNLTPAEIEKAEGLSEGIPG